MDAFDPPLEIALNGGLLVAVGADEAASSGRKKMTRLILLMWSALLCAFLLNSYSDL
jgi:hypothetical protein